MIDTGKSQSKSEIAETDDALSLIRPSKRDYASYLREMSIDLARIADKTGLPREIGYLLRMAAIAARKMEKEEMQNNTAGVDR